jgi:hypothetical protein
MITEDALANMRNLFPVMALPFAAMLGAALNTVDIDGGVEHDRCP